MPPPQVHRNQTHHEFPRDSLAAPAFPFCIRHSAFTQPPTFYFQTHSENPLIPPKSSAKIGQTLLKSAYFCLILSTRPTNDRSRGQSPITFTVLISPAR